MTNRLQLDRFDRDFAARTTEQDWQRILVLRNHPRMLEGVLSYDSLIPEYFADNTILNRVVIELRRFQMIVYTLHLHDTRDPDDPRTGLTHSRLQKLALTHNLASPGGVTTFIGLLLLAGYLRRQRSAIDRRIVLRSAMGLERFGMRISAAFAGVIIVEARKELAMPVKAAKVPRTCCSVICSSTGYMKSACSSSLEPTRKVTSLP